MIRLLMILIVSILVTGCAVASKKELLKPEFNPEKTVPFSRESRPAMETIEINAENFKIDNAEIPDGEKIKRVKIIGAELRDVISLLAESTNENIVFQLESEANNQQNDTNQSQRYGSGAFQGNGSLNNNYNNSDQETNDYLLQKSKVYVAASNIGFGRLLKKSVGNKISVGYSDGTYYLGNIRTVTVKIPSIKELGSILQNAIATMGGNNVSYDSVTSSLSFSAREKEYNDIMKYLDILRQNLYVIEYEISIYNVELKDDYSLGINWNVIPSLTNEFGIVSVAAAAAGTVGAAQTPLTFGALINNGSYNGQALINALEHFGKVESIQRPKLLGLAGTNVTLTDGLQEPYIKELQTTSVSNGTVQTSTVSAMALSGMEITLNSNILDETVITDIELKINDIVGYSNFEVDKTKYSQPKTVTKMIHNTMRVQPGVPIVISGLFRNTSDKGYKGIPGMGENPAGIVGGTRYEGTTKSEMVIIVTPRVIKYTMR